MSTYTTRNFFNDTFMHCRIFNNATTANIVTTRLKLGFNKCYEYTVRLDEPFYGINYFK